MSILDENEAKTDTKPLLDAAMDEEERERGADREPRHAGQAATEEAASPEADEGDNETVSGATDESP